MDRVYLGQRPQANQMVGACRRQCGGSKKKRRRKRLKTRKVGKKRNYKYNQ